MNRRTQILQHAKMIEPADGTARRVREFSTSKCGQQRRRIGWRGLVGRTADDVQYFGGRRIAVANIAIYLDALVSDLATGRYENRNIEFLLERLNHHTFRADNSSEEWWIKIRDFDDPLSLFLDLGHCEGNNRPFYCVRRHGIVG